LVHLDEETVITESSLIGIVNFANKNKHPIGQGHIAYGKAQVHNWPATLADSYRVGSHLAMSKFAFKTFHRPLGNFNGSFLVCKHGVEKRVSFDHGFESSICEDCYFAMLADNMGFTFDWIEGEMLEQSAFGFWDFVRQRKRWVQGLLLVYHSRNLKFGPSKWLCLHFKFYMLILVPLRILFSIILAIYPISFHAIDLYLPRIAEISYTYVFLLGMVNSFDFAKLDLKTKVYCFCGTWFWIRYGWLAEAFAVIWALLTTKDQFFVIKK
jgi:egghead protein (zeste-white 4 protein)